MWASDDHLPLNMMISIYKLMSILLQFISITL